MEEKLVISWAVLWGMKYLSAIFIYRKIENETYCPLKEPEEYAERHLKSALLPWLSTKEKSNRLLIVLIWFHNIVGILGLLFFIALIILPEIL